MNAAIDHLSHSLFYQLAALLLLAGVLGFIGQKLKQPLIVVFIALGLLVGPDMLGVVQHTSEGDHSTIETLAELGIALLLFMVGLKLNPDMLRSMGSMALIAGFFQVTITTALGMGLTLSFGFSWQAALICGLGLAFSSTIIVVKLLSDQREIESLYGKMALGILIIQDLVVIVTVVVMSSLAQGESGGVSLSDFAKIGMNLVLILLVVWFFTKYLSHGLANALSRSSELMVIFAIGYASAFAAICDTLDLSKELGGLLAGISLAPTAFRTAIYARLASLRDFLLLFFFIGLGTNLSLSNIEEQLLPALVISAFVLLGKPLIIMIIMGGLGYRKRTFFQSGVVMSQISEFSLILSAVALSGGFLTEEQFNIMTLTGMITIGVSTYLALNSVTIYKKIENMLTFFERERVHEEDFTEKIDRKYDVIIFGLGRYGAAMAKRFQKAGHKILGVDFDPSSVKEAQRNGIPAIYGDASDPEFPAFLPLDHAHSVILCIPHAVTGPMIIDTRRSLTRALRSAGYTGRIAVTSHRREREGNLPEDELKDLGVDILLRPYHDAAQAGAEQIMALQNKDMDKKTGS